MNRITLLVGARFISEHIGAQVYFDSRRRLIKTTLDKGIKGELMQERQADGSYKDQYLIIEDALYQRYIQNPWTRDSQVRTDIVGIAPRVSGPIIQVAVHDNQEVKKGDLLFEIDPADFQAQLNLATGQVLNAEANFEQQKQNLDLQTDLLISSSIQSLTNERAI